jgi:hypothetical protein
MATMNGYNVGNGTSPYEIAQKTLNDKAEAMNKFREKTGLINSELTDNQYMLYKKPVQPVILKNKPKLEPIKPLGIKPMGTSLKPKLAGNVTVPEIPSSKNNIQNYTESKALQIQGKPSGYINKGDNTGRQEFRKGGQFKDMPFGMPLKEQNPYLVPEYNQPMVGKTILPDVNRPMLKDTNANEFKTTFGTDNEDVQVPTIVGGQYIGEDGAWERYKATKGEKFKTMTDPGSYSNFYNQTGELGLMQSKPKQKFQQGGWLDGLTTNKFDMGGLLDGLDKGTQVPDATSTAKPVVNLNFAVTPAQKQVAAKNKRQAEVDMQVDYPEFYRNQNPLDKKAVKPYSVEDYKKGIKEPGLQTSMDPIDLVGTGVYKGLAKALGAKEVAVAADAALFNSLDKSKVLYNQLKIKAKDDIYKLKYKKDIASLESKKFNAMQKMNNPEGWKRLREQGVEPKQFFDQLNKSKITSIRNEGSWDNGAQINIDFDQVRRLQKEGYDLSVENIIDHEIGHRMQRGFNSKAVKDYNQAKSYNYRNKVPEYTVYSTPLDRESELLLSPVIKNPNKNSDYFLFGSDNKERLPFLREAKESMVSKGFIDNIYSKITPETVKKFLKEVPSNRFSTFLDIKNPITHRRLSGLLNKTPIVAGVGLGVNELTKDKKSNSGWLDNLK